MFGDVSAVSEKFISILSYQREYRKSYISADNKNNAFFFLRLQLSNSQQSVTCKPHPQPPMREFHCGFHTWIKVFELNLMLQVILSPDGQTRNTRHNVSQRVNSPGSLSLRGHLQHITSAES